MTPVFAVEGGVAAPDVIGFTDPQIEAICRLTGGVDPVTGEQYESMMGAYKPYLDRAEEVFETGVTSLEGSQGSTIQKVKSYRHDPTTGVRHLVWMRAGNLFARADTKSSTIRLSKM